jgi:hypothetical protein
MTKFVVAILLLALTMPASAQDTHSANYILPGCKSWLDRGEKLFAPDEAFCAGFVIGLGYGAWGKDFCSPRGDERSGGGRRHQVHRGKA